MLLGHEFLFELKKSELTSSYVCMFMFIGRPLIIDVVVTRRDSQTGCIYFYVFNHGRLSQSCMYIIIIIDSLFYYYFRDIELLVTVTS